MSKIYKKLDARNTGYADWKYYLINPSRFSNGTYLTSSQANQKFYAWREWCWDTWGSSKELHAWLKDKNSLINMSGLSCQNEHWVWQNNEHYMRIYLKGDEEMTLFLLKWK